MSLNTPNTFTVVMLLLGQRRSRSTNNKLRTVNIVCWLTVFNDIVLININPYITNLIHLNLQPLEVVSR